MKKSVMIGIGLTLFCIIAGTLVSYAAGSNPPSNGVKYTNNGQTTVQGALNDLYSKIDGSSCLPSRTASTETLVAGGSKTYDAGSYAKGWTVSCANKTCPTCGDGTSSNISNYNTVSGSGTVNASISVTNAFVYYIPKIFAYNQGKNFGYTNPSSTQSSTLTYSNNTITYRMPFQKITRSGTVGYGTIISGVGVLDTNKYTLVSSGNTASSKTINRNLETCIVGYYSENFNNTKTTPTSTGDVQILNPVTKLSSSSFTINQLVLTYDSSSLNYMTLNYKVYCLK